jgi:hypothetical protein
VVGVVTLPGAGPPSVGAPDTKTTSLSAGPVILYEHELLVSGHGVPPGATTCSKLKPPALPLLGQFPPSASNTAAGSVPGPKLRTSVTVSPDVTAPPKVKYAHDPAGAVLKNHGAECGAAVAGAEVSASPAAALASTTARQAQRRSALLTLDPLVAEPDLTRTA